MRRRRSPRVGFPVYECQPGIGDVEAAVLVDGVDVRGGGDVERVAADDAAVLEVDGA